MRSRATASVPPRRISPLSLRKSHPRATAAVDCARGSRRRPRRPAGVPS